MNINANQGLKFHTDLLTPYIFNLSIFNNQDIEEINF